MIAAGGGDHGKVSITGIEDSIREGVPLDGDLHKSACKDSQYARQYPM